MEKAMEQVKKEHYSIFCKHFPNYNHALGPKFLQEILAHYDNNSELEMLMEKTSNARVFFSQQGVESCFVEAM
jgi:hypothetical protein